LPGLFLGFSWLVEAAGYYLRVIGARAGQASMGYTRHVQLATLMRAGSFVALPLIAYNVDLGHSFSSLRTIPLITFGILILGLSACLSKVDSVYVLLKLVNKVLTRISGSEIDRNKREEIESITFGNVDFRVTFLSLVTFVITSNAFFLTMIYASKHPEYRASIFQFTPFISFIGTIIATFYLDTKVSSSIDSLEGVDIVNSLLLGRLIGSGMGVLFYLFL